MVAISLVAGCATTVSRAPVPEALVAEVQLGGFTGVRFWGDALPRNFNTLVKRKFEQRRAREKAEGRRRQAPQFLAISGGGSDGAFGAGLLVGWTERGDRPQFDVVTGVSTGALIAPFAFLGSAYDRQLQELYTLYQTSDLIAPRLLAGLFGGVALADVTPFEALIARYISPEVLAAIAAEHRRGRSLLIGTTNIDAQRPVIWDMGAIAASGHPRALDLFRRILRASASIPGIFPPVRITVKAEGKTFDELHVDGGLTAQVFFLPSQIMLGQVAKRLGLRRTPTLYVIRNGHVRPEYKPINAKLAAVASRSISTLIKSQANGELFMLYARAQRDRVRYRLAHIPRTFRVVSKETFDKAYMQALFERGRTLARAGYRWATKPPS
ncbi:MAG: patatin-like phospholipase family protein [Pseudomonadota bacterium]